MIEIIEVKPQTCRLPEQPSPVLHHLCKEIADSYECALESWEPPGFEGKINQFTRLPAAQAVSLFTTITPSTTPLRGTTLHPTKKSKVAPWTTVFLYKHPTNLTSHFPS